MTSDYVAGGEKKKKPSLNSNRGSNVQAKPGQTATCIVSAFLLLTL